MTRDKDFKALVRARMRHTGESYTTARAALLRVAASEDTRWHRAQREQQMIIGRWFIDGRLRSIPARRKVRAAVLLEVLTRFEPGVSYPETEVNHRLRRVNADFAFLRRELVSLGYLMRAAGIYRVSRTPPVRSQREHSELPVWEELWLPGFMAGHHDHRDRKAS